jgi:hypothetical protein
MCLGACRQNDEGQTEKKGAKERHGGELFCQAAKDPVLCSTDVLAALAVPVAAYWNYSS